MIDELTIYNLAINHPNTVDLVREVERITIEEFAENLIGEIEAYASAGYNLDVVRWVMNYAEQIKGEQE